MTRAVHLLIVCAGILAGLLCLSLPASDSVAEQRNYGVGDRNTRSPTYRINGREATREEVEQAIQARIPDDAALLRVTVVGKVEARKRVLDSIETKIKSKALLQAYDPADKVITQRGFANLMGDPDVFVQRPDGTLLLHLKAWDASGEKELLTVVADPDRRPKPKPDPKPPDPKPDPCPGPCPIPVPDPPPDDDPWDRLRLPPRWWPWWPRWLPLSPFRPSPAPSPLPTPPVPLPDGVTPPMFWALVIVAALAIFGNRKKEK